MADLKQKTVSGLKWSFIDRISTQGIGFVISIIIARILSPADYGVIGMIAIFTGVASIFIWGGFSNALIRKQDRTDLDFSIVFYYNLSTSIVLYCILFFCAPLIADFYKTPLLIPVTRVVGLNMIIGALGTIQSVKLNCNIDFKTQAKISLIALVLSGTIGILMALKGFGVWALVCQGLVSTFISTLALWFFIRWKPTFEFSMKSFRVLFGFGSRMMLSGLLDTVYTNIYQMVIGKKFSATELGYYTRASTLAQLPSVNMTNIIQRVTYPVLSELQNDDGRLADSYRKLLKMTTYIIFPLMMLLAALGEPLVKILLTEKWMPAVVLLQVLCFNYMWIPVHAMNLNLLQVKGRSDLFLRLEIIKKSIITIVLFASVPFGVLVMCYGTIITSIISLIINTHFTGKLIKVGFLIQIRDFLPFLLLSLASGIAAFLPSLWISNSYLQLLIGGTLGTVLFIGASYLLRWVELKELAAVCIKYMRRSG